MRIFKLTIILITLLFTSKAFADDTIYNPVKFARNEVIFSNSQIPVSVTDPTPKKNASGSIFPGGRGFIYEGINEDHFIHFDEFIKN